MKKWIDIESLDFRLKANQHGAYLDFSDAIYRKLEGGARCHELRRIMDKQKEKVTLFDMIKAADLVGLDVEIEFTPRNTP